jgi:hypothetical protein
MARTRDTAAIAAFLALMTGCADDTALTSATEASTEGTTAADAGETEGTSTTDEGPETSTGGTTSSSSETASTPTESSSTGETSTSTTGETTGSTGTGDDGVAIPGCGEHVLVTDTLKLGGHNALADFAEFCGQYDGVDGDLVLESPWQYDGDDDVPLPDFSGLECLRCVTGHLSIRNVNVETLSGLDNLTFAGALTLERVLDITDLEGLGALEEVAGTFRVQMDHGFFVPSHLSSFAGLDSLVRVGELVIDTNEALESLAGLESVAEIGALEILDNPLLGDLDGLIGLTSLGSLRIRYNETLGDIHGLVNVETPIDRLVLFNNEQLLDLVGAPPLAPLGTLVLGDLPGLVDLWGLPPLPEELTHVAVEFVPGIADLSPFAGLRRLHGSLVIMGCDELSTLHGLETLESVAGTLTLEWNPALTSIAALGGLTDASLGSLKISDSPLLTSLQGLEGVVEIRGLDEDDPALFGGNGGYSELGELGITDLSGLDNLTTIGGEFPVMMLIYESPALTSLNGLSSLSECSGLALFRDHALTDISALAGISSMDELMIADNDALISLAGLESLAKIGDEGLQISDNAAVADLSPLSGLMALSGPLSITNNCAITDADAEALVASILEGGGVVESVEIDANGAKCAP